MHESFSEFLRMDGFAVWVWSAFGLTAVVMGLMAVLIPHSYRRIHASVRRRHSSGGQ
jgi:heme exporter protein CcmD